MSTDLASTFFSKGAATFSPQQSQAKTLAQAPVPQADVERKEQMGKAWDAYVGKFADPLKTEKDEINKNVKPNKCAPIVKKGVSFLFNETLKIETAANQDFTDGVWGDDDEKMTMLAKIGTNGGVFGQVFLKLIPAQGDMDSPRIVNLDPRIVRIVSDPEDCDLHLAYVIEYPKTSDMEKRQIIARVDPDSDLSITGDYDLEDTWTITNYTKKGSASYWSQVGEVEDWPYPFAPIFTWQNLPCPNESWGEADLTDDIIHMNKVLNFTMSNISAILYWHAHPKTWGKGFKASQMSVAVNETLVIEAPDGTLQNLEMHTDLSSSRNFAEDVMARMNEQSRIPGIALGTNEPKGNISGIALKQYYQPILEKTTLKQRTYGKGIREVTRAALVVGSKIAATAYEDYEVKLHWQPILPTDDLAAAQEALILKQIGVSDDTIMSGLGLNPDDEAKKSAVEDQKKMVAYSRGQGMPPMQPAPLGMPPQAPGQQQQQGGQKPQ